MFLLLSAGQVDSCSGYDWVSHIAMPNQKAPLSSNVRPSQADLRASFEHRDHLGLCARRVDDRVRTVVADRPGHLHRRGRSVRVTLAVDAGGLPVDAWAA
jgi:hypothetical protein